MVTRESLDGSLRGGKLLVVLLLRLLLNVKLLRREDRFFPKGLQVEWNAVAVGLVAHGEVIGQSDTVAFEVEASGGGRDSEAQLPLFRS